MSAPPVTPKRDSKGCYVRGSSGNPHGRPRKGSPGRAPDVLRILSAPVTVKINGAPHKVSLAEARFRQLAMRAMKGDEKAAIKCLALAERYELLTPAIRRETYPGGAVLRIPWESKPEEFIEKYKKYGDPPWPGDRDGLIPPDRRDRFNPNGLTVS